MSNYPSGNTNDDQPQLSRGRLKAFLSRRHLLSSAIFGGTAVALVLSVPERNEAQVIDNKTSATVEKILAAIDRMPSLSNYDQDLFLKAASLILGIVEKDANARSSYDALHAYIDQPLIKVESGYKTNSLGLSEEISNIIGATYLRAIEILHSSTLSEEAVLTKLRNPKGVFDSFEEDFIASLSNAVQSKVQSYTPFSYTLSNATEQVVSLAESIYIQQEAGQDNLRACSINGQPTRAWVCIIFIVIIVILIV
ncbi:hypothetical protein [Nostoc sp. WHI]|uniref:hypothetical protein n=1 Tax=Nostoc sp. WHI TaxID=2650611 RepID=UPI0018C74BCE|nr:hypothetical protein [Nostoc sp. WHI]MBG1270517.1 hypothetical protein [Nostoc sp. WHI]